MMVVTSESRRKQMSLTREQIDAAFERARKEANRLSDDCETFAHIFNGVIVIATVDGKRIKRSYLRWTENCAERSESWDWTDEITGLVFDLEGVGGS